MKNWNGWVLSMVAVLAMAIPIQAQELDVPLFPQEGRNWCWNASAQMVLSFFGHEATQTDIAAWAVAGHDVGNHLQGDTRLTRVGRTLINRRGTAAVLRQFGPVDSVYLDRALSFAEVEDNIDANRPSILGVYWTQNGRFLGSGHAIVLYGYADGNLVRLRDPEPSTLKGGSGTTYLVDYDALFSNNARYYPTGSASLGNFWGATLRTGRALDVVFLIDTTGSMGPYINNVKAGAQDLIDQMILNYSDLRIAVVEFQDYSGWTGVARDKITEVLTPFTSDMTAARNAINALSLGSGGDIPESVFSALIRTMLNLPDDVGTSAGEWRAEAERRIILMGDARGHDPEPWEGGFSFPDLVRTWNELDRKIAVHALHVGSEPRAASQFASIATATGGSTRRDVAAGDVSGAISGMIEEFAENPRSPQGAVATYYPIFTFDTPAEDMLPDIRLVMLEIERLDERRDTWRRFFRVRLPGDASTWQAPRPLPMGTYRWRLGYSRPTGELHYKDGSRERIPGENVTEEDWTVFTRAEVEAGRPTQVTPFHTFTADDRAVVYQITTAPNAEAYVLEIWTQDRRENWRPIRRSLIRSRDPDAAVIEIGVGGHRPGQQYRWRVQSLNLDRRRPVDDQWVGRGP